MHEKGEERSVCRAHALPVNDIFILCYVHMLFYVHEKSNIDTLGAVCV